MKSNNTKYAELADWLRKNIRSNHFKSGDRLMSEHSLCKEFGVSRHTVRAAIATLEEEGLLSRKQGSGTYINSKQDDKKNIGVLLTHSSAYTFPNIVSGIEKVLAEKGHYIILGLTHNKVDIEHNRLLSMLDADIDGLIVEAVRPALANPSLNSYSEFYRRKIPVIFINAFHPKLDCNYIENGDIEGAEIATGHLIKNGHRKIGGMFNRSSIQGERRYEGYINALHKEGIAIDESRVIWYTDDSYSLIFSDEGLTQLSETFAKCTAVLCYSDLIASRLVRSAAKLGLSIPDDLSIASFDNALFANLITPRITTIAHRGEDIGKLAAESILEIIQNPEHTVRHVYKPELIIRDSVRTV